MRTGKHHLAAIVLATAARVADAQAATDDLASVPYVVWNSGIYPYQGIATRNSFYWVDDNTVLFRGSLGKGGRDASGEPLGKPALYLWRLGEKPQLHGTDPVAASREYCAAEGWDRYSRIETDPKTGVYKVIGYMAGPIGNEQEEPLPPDDSLPLALQGRSVGDIQLIEAGKKCARPSDPTMVGRFWVADTDNRYRLDFGAVKSPRDASFRMVLVKADGQRTELPITSAETWSSCTHFHRFDGAFLVWDCIGVLNTREWQAKDNCWPVWRVVPEKEQTDKICLPFGAWVENGIDIVPTKAGLFFKAFGRPDPGSGDPGTAGLYMLKRDTAHRVLKGFIFDPVTSPSGCKVVFSYVANGRALSRFRPETVSILAVDVCTAK